MVFGINGPDNIKGTTYASKTNGLNKTDTNNIEISFNTKGVPGMITPSGTDLRFISGQFDGINLDDYKYKQGINNPKNFNTGDLPEWVSAAAEKDKELQFTD